MLLQITYHDKATQTATEKEDTIKKILKAITTLCTKVDSMDNEIQKLKSKASQQHDYKNAELRRPEDGKNPDLKGDDGKLLKTKDISIGVSIPSLKHAFINISVPPKCTYLIGFLALISCISLFIICLFIIGILAFPLVYLQSMICSL
ncbi:hypothetical protein MTR67_001448 [Solanum verrucosum]|uniref:Uncharacterized protein n=1 Tax=Solanum verrucosum TaxID=315347 RepID=A0AAF0T8F7_SOLVR|nr:hypothetical protein MTR67_001448 [Solanum verrucosum]